jgi:UDP-3-O-[3-hydroxymyristoyl] N-acetylglucosamine deacetylase
MNTGDGAQQGTVSRDVSFAGLGLHTGRRCSVTVKPAPAGHGIVFCHLDGRNQKTLIRADWRNVRDLPLCTCLSDTSGKSIRTVEHLLAAFYACGIDNSVIEVVGGEIPILDGSAKPFVDALSSAVETQPAKRKVAKILKPIVAHIGPRWIKIRPFNGFRIEVQTYVKPFGRLPWLVVDVSRASFAREIAPARTFGSLSDGIMAKAFTRMLKDPICLGANTSNAVVLFGRRVMTPGGLRFPDEFTRHRALDIVGDLMLAGCDFQGRFVCFSPTHRLAKMTLQAVFKDPSHYANTGGCTEE